MTETSTSHSQARMLADPVDAFRPLALHAMFWRPAYLEASAWLEHIPFAFWLIEAQRPKVFVELGTQQGTSYFSFCQAVDRLQIDTRCFAIDTWKGDEHTGPYDEKVFNNVKAHNDAQYAGFSRLLRSTFDEALDRFTDGSIDLLHLDGLPTAEAVGHELERWLPKMSERGVVIVHNTNRRERDVDVFKLFERLQSQYPAFEFLHGNGLGVLGVGAKQADLLGRLFASNRDEAAKRSIQEVFARLGRACADAYTATQQGERASKLGSESSKQKKLLEETEASLKKAREDLSLRSRELTETRTRLQTQVDQHALERGQLSERASLLQELRSELKAEVLRLQDVVAAMSADKQGRAEEMGKIERAHALSQQQCDALGKTVEERDARIAALVNQRDKLQADNKGFQARAEQREKELAEARANAATLAAQLDAQGQELQRRDADIAELTRQNNARQASLNSLQEELAQRDQALAAQAQQHQAIESERAQREATIAELTRQGDEQRAAIGALEERLAERDASVAELTRQGGEQRATIAAMEVRLVKLGEALTVLESQTREMESLAEQNAALRTQLEQVQAQQAAAAKSRASSDATRDATRDATAEQQAKLAGLAAELDRRARQIADLEAEKAMLNTNVQERFRELAKLTQLLEAAKKAGDDRDGQATVLAQLAEKEKAAAERATAHQAMVEQLHAELAKKDGQMQALVQKLATNASLQADRVARSSSFRLFGASDPHAGLGKRERKLRKQAQLIRESGLFDENWYLARYPDVKQSNIDPAEHFLHYGATEMRDPSPFFDTKAYVAANADVVESQINPLVHYIHHGSKEGRAIQSVKE